jgi:hypothetical protein
MFNIGAIGQPLTPQNAIAQSSPQSKRDHLINHQPEANNINKFDNNYCYLLLLQREY